MRKTVLLAFAGLTFAQTPAPEKKPEFEVASIHPAPPSNEHHTDTDENLYRVRNLSLKRLIASAYGIDAAQVLGGPGWADSDGFDITARIPDEFIRRNAVPLMLQSLLADRFQLVIHREPRQVSGYALVVSKKGPKMQLAKPDERDSNVHSNGTHLTASNVPMAQLARDLSRNREIGELVIDKTGLTGKFTFELDWKPERPDSNDGPSIFAALEEQLGLKLESAKIPVQAVVIDRAEKPKDN